MGTLRTAVIEIFVNNSSMRGFGKLYRTKFIFLKFLWAIYIALMIATLLISCYFLVYEYSSYYTTVQDSEAILEYTNFPATTVCSQQPLRPHIQDWAETEGMTPQKLSDIFRKSMLEKYQLGEKHAAREFFFADKITTFFQNLNVTEAVKVGLQQEELVLFCMQRHTKNNIESVSHDEVCKVKVRRLRHAQYLNCYEIVIDPEDSPQVSSISLILKSGSSAEHSSDSSDDSHAHIHDLFTQSMGFRLTLHEPGVFPDIDRVGFNVAAKSSTEVKYQVIQKKEINLGVQHQFCLEEDQVSKIEVRDLDLSFSYSQTACISEAIGQLILQECQCVSFFHLIRLPPNDTAPYCYKYEPGNIEALAARLDCVRHINVPEKIAKLSTTVCAKRCDTTSYDVQVIPSIWMPTAWQLHWVVTVSTAWEEMFAEGKSEEVRERAKESLLSYMHDNSNSTNISEHGGPTSSIELDKLALVTISRLSYNTVKRKETLQITLSALLAQMGGLGSLTIGCTLAFFFEIVEFLFLLIHKFIDIKSQRKKQQDPSHPKLLDKENT